MILFLSNHFLKYILKNDLIKIKNDNKFIYLSILYEYIRYIFKIYYYIKYNE